jgi:diacylglycerol kinase (ATP)
VTATHGRPVIGLVVNPWSNKGKAVRVGDKVRDLLADSATVRHFCGDSEAATVELLREASRTCDAVFACGGDGMVHLAVNVLAGGEVPLGIVPAGTGNDNADVLGLPAEPLEAATILRQLVADGQVSRIDLGHCDGPPLAPWLDGRWFIGVLYGGFDSAVNERANRMHWPKGKRRYDVAIAAELANLTPRPATIVLDEGTPDERTLTDPITLVAIGNTRQYGGGKKITPDALWDDGFFDLTVVGPISRRRLAVLAPKLPKAGHIGEPEVSTYRARSVRFDGADIVYYADGERIGPLPVTTTVVPRALPVLMPTTTR